MFDIEYILQKQNTNINAYTQDTSSSDDDTDKENITFPSKNATQRYRGSCNDHL